jgi:hypothetical protein
VLVSWYSLPPKKRRALENWHNQTTGIFRSLSYSVVVGLPSFTTACHQSLWLAFRLLRNARVMPQGAYYKAPLSPFSNALQMRSRALP